MAVYTKGENDTDYIRSDDIPSSSSNLGFNKSKSTCTNEAVPIWNKESWNITIDNLTKSGTSCYLYFDKESFGITSSDIIAGITGTSTNDSMFAGISGDGVYTWTKGDYSGGDQPIKYFRGNVNNNWVVFGKDGDNYIWWRIIRNNSNSSLRMIYAGTSASKTSAPANSAAMLSTRTFNPSYNKNYYVGLKYSTDSMHGTSTNAPILGASNSTDKTTLYGWYNATLGKSTEYSSKIDLDAGFCGDRNHSTSTSGPATASAVSPGASTTIYYGSYINVVNKKVPSLLCPNASDKFTDIPVGMITADEVMMAGMVYGTANTNSWVHIGQHYWTMSPDGFRSSNTFMFCVFLTGSLGSLGLSGALGVRPVINLKSSTLFEPGGTGLANNPYVVLGN